VEGEVLDVKENPVYKVSTVAYLELLSVFCMVRARSQQKMMRRSTVFLSNWREQGITYLKYLNVCTDALHSTVKEGKAAAKYTKYSAPGFQAMELDSATGLFVKREKIPEEISKY
jgi:hypothetical protein